MQYLFCLDEQKKLLNTVVTHTLIHENTAKYIQCIHKDYEYSAASAVILLFVQSLSFAGFVVKIKFFQEEKKIGRSHYFGRINFKKL